MRVSIISAGAELATGLMGYEYMLDFEPADPAEADVVLRGVRGFAGCIAANRPPEIE